MVAVRRWQSWGEEKFQGVFGSPILNMPIGESKVKLLFGFHFLKSSNGDEIPKE